LNETWCTLLPSLPITLQHERGVLPILVARVELRLAFVEQNGLGLTLASRDK